MQEKERVILNYLKENAYRCCRKATGQMKYSFIDPGGHYSNNLWDWDGYFALEALIDITEKLKADESFDYEYHKSLVIECGKGCVSNFIYVQSEEGYIPINMTVDNADAVKRAAQKPELYDNQMKPVLSRYVEILSEYSGDYTWVDVDKIAKYFEYYDRNQYDTRVGLYVWKNDLKIGIDNNPTVFFRPEKSSADIYLNTLMYVDMLAFSRILSKIGREEQSKVYRSKAQRLKDVINAEMYDERDGYYYSQDVISDETVFRRGYHINFPMYYKGLPIKLRTWVGLMPLWAGIADEKQAKNIVMKNFNDDTLFCEAGIRSLAKNEKMFSEKATNNPSNHNGPVWTINNVIVWKGLKRYGFTTLAEELRQRTLNLLSNSVIKDGGFYESWMGDGTHMLYCGFLSWNCLVSEMIER